MAGTALAGRQETVVDSPCIQLAAEERTAQEKGQMVVPALEKTSPGSSFPGLNMLAIFSCKRSIKCQSRLL